MDRLKSDMADDAVKNELHRMNVLADRFGIVGQAHSSWVISCWGRKKCATG